MLPNNTNTAKFWIVLVTFVDPGKDNPDSTLQETKSGLDPPKTDPDPTKRSYIRTEIILFDYNLREAAK